MDNEPPEQPVVVPIVADKVVILPQKQPDYTHRPKGAPVWALLLPLIVVELWAVATNVEYTLSRTVWWLLGPELRPRWWLVGMPLSALLLWSVPHFLTAGRVGPVHLLWTLGLSLVIACIGVLATA